MGTIILSTIIITVSFTAIYNIYNKNNKIYNWSNIKAYKNKLANSWELHKIFNGKAWESVEGKEWLLELTLSGDSYSVTYNVLGEPEAQIGKWDILNNGTVLQINNYFLLSKPVFISTWYKIIKLSNEELLVESAFDDKEQFYFKAAKN
ncbi:MAG TPA: hypothetical protein P5250_05530 [Bacteroidales bacterium]|nr:hypothetical protein [Bacteroidales bacterium]